VLIVEKVRENDTTPALSKLVTFEEFVDRLTENSGVHYELHNGEIVEMPQPVGEHEEIKGFLARKVTVEFDRLNLPYFMPNQAIVIPHLSNWVKTSIFSLAEMACFRENLPK
jgi:Uma2 family endonuclease